MFLYGVTNHTVLTLNHLLKGRPLNLPRILSREDSVNISNYHHVRNVLQHYIKWWQNEYFLEPREFHESKDRNKIEEACNVEVARFIQKDITPLRYLTINFKVGINDSLPGETRTMLET